MKGLLYLAEGFEICEALITVDMLRRAGLEIKTVSISDDVEVLSSQKVIVHADGLLKDEHVEEYDFIVLPGGKLGTYNLEHNTRVIEDVQKHYSNGKLTCAICAAPSILGHLGYLKDRKYTCFPSFDETSFGGEYQMELAVTDGNVITGRGMGATIEFARHILMKVADKEALDKVEQGMQYEHSFRK